MLSYVKKQPRTLKPIKMGAYVGLQLRDADGVTRKAYLHRLICEAFNGPAPDGMLCRHIDGDRTNNAAENLRWGTQSQNNLDKRLHGTAPAGERNPMSKLTDRQVSDMRSVRAATGRSYAQIAQAFGVSAMTAYRAINAQSWSHI